MTTKDNGRVSVTTEELQAEELREISGGAASDYGIAYLIAVQKQQANQANQEAR